MKAFDRITDAQSELIARQQMFFVATAPLAQDGHVNLSPKGLDSFVVLGPNRVAYLDLGGSGIETHAHLRENGRICLMFCAFDGEPLIVRLYGRGSAHAYGTPRFDELRPEFPAITVPVRGIIEVDVDRTQDSCGWAVPLYTFEGQRDRLLDHNAKRDQETFFERRLATNARSIDGLPGLERP
jgi:hypothetical protein